MIQEGSDPAAEEQANRENDIPVKKNRISSIWKSDNDKKAGLRPVIILLAIAATAVIAVLVITLFYKKPESFSPSEKKQETTSIDTVEKTAPAVSENIHIKRGIESYEKRYFNDAISEFNEVVESDAPDKDKAVALTYLGMISDDRGEYGKAVDFYQRAMVYDKNSPDIYRNLALAYRHKKNYEKAISSAQKSLSIDSNDLNSKILLGNIYFEMGKYSEAVKQYREALEASPDNGAVLYNLGAAYLKTGDEFAAIEYMKKAGASDRIGEVAFRAYSRLGILFTERKDYDLAGKYLKTASDLRPDDAAVHYNLGIVYLRQNRKDQAMEELTRAGKLGKDDVAMLENLGEAFSSLGDYDRSLEAYMKIIKLNRRNVKILARVAEIYYEKGDLDRAYDTYMEITVMEPATENARVAYLNMGNILDDTQRHDEAIKAYKKALSISPKDDSVYYNLGIAYRHAGRAKMAVDAWKKAAELNESDPKPILAIADYYYDKGFYDLAEKEYRKIALRWPGIQETHFKIGTIYYKKEQYDYALQAYQRVLEINDTSDVARRAYINTALLMVKKDNSEETFNRAEQMVKKSLLIKPGDPDSLFALGTIYAGMEMHNRAIETFYQVLKSARENTFVAETYNSIGKSYYKKKKYKKALQSFTRGLEENPSNEEIRMNRRAAMQEYESELAEER